MIVMHSRKLDAADSRLPSWGQQPRHGALAPRSGLLSARKTSKTSKTRKKRKKSFESKERHKREWVATGFHMSWTRLLVSAVSVSAPPAACGKTALSRSSAHCNRLPCEHGRTCTPSVSDAKPVMLESHHQVHPLPDLKGNNVGKTG